MVRDFVSVLSADCAAVRSRPGCMEKGSSAFRDFFVCAQEIVVHCRCCFQLFPERMWPV